MDLRVEELARRAGVTVDTVRYYQSQRLLPPPQRRGRVAVYGDEHVDALLRIKDLKAKGFTLRAIARLVGEGADRADEALAAAVVETFPQGAGEGSLSLEGLAEATGVTPTLLEAIVREGLLIGSEVDGEPRFGHSDARLVETGLKLLGTGLPLSELLALARAHDRAMRQVAHEAVEMFIRFVRDPIRASASDEDEAAGRMVEAFRTMLPATTDMVAHHFRRVLLQEARARIEAVGSDQERAAVDAEAEALA